MATILNGELPAWLLATVPWDAAERLRPGALADLIRLNTAFRARFGHNLVINESYRDLPTQKAYYKNPPSGVGTAAWPGTSNHGWGLALDLHLTAEESAWMRANAPSFGWVNPTWAHDGRGVEEPWHWEHSSAESVIPDVITPAPLTSPTPTHHEEDDMLPLILWCYAELVGRTAPPSTDEVANWISGTPGWTSARVLASFLGARAERGSVVKAYRDILGRKPESEAAINGHLAGGSTIGQVRINVASSPEARR